MNKSLAIVYMVAGISSRFGGKIKQFAKVGPNGEILIEHSLNQALSAGFTKIIFIVGEKTENPFKEKFGEMYKQRKVFYARQSFDSAFRDKPWGTAEALCSAKEVIDCPFVVCNGDDIYGEYAFKTLAEHLKNSEECAVLGYNLMEALPDTAKANRAIFKVNEEGYVLDLKEVFNILKSDLSLTKTKADDLCSMNIYALHPGILGHLNDLVKEFKRNHGGDRKIECLLPDKVGCLIREGKARVKMYLAKEKPIGITCPEDEEVVRRKLSMI
jgi:NDP-sugar pyrophosphorylase family protein